MRNCFFILLPLLSLFSTCDGEKNVLVAGGAGFLGSHLCKYLIEQGNSVICVDNLSTGSIDNIKELFDNPLFTYIQMDIVDPLTIEDKIEQIYNLASPASPIKYQSNPIQTLRTNFLGTLNLLELAKKHNAKFFQASTSEIYGNPLQHPQTESYLGNVSCTGIRACYDEGKRVAETLCFEFYRKHDLQIKVGRIFNTYGPNMAIDDGRVISNFLIQAIEKQPITIFGNGLQTRSFCYVDDLIEAIVRFMDTPKDMIGPINLGNPNEVTILDLTKIVKTLTKSTSPLNFHPLPQDDPIKRRPDISKAKKVLNWEPKISLETGLGKTLRYFLKKRKERDSNPRYP